MVEFYVERIKKGKKTIDQVPKLWRKDVQWELENNAIN